MRPTGNARVIFITGTDTGVGKTVLTALLLQHLRAAGVRTIALKPFCSGSRADAKLLHSLQLPLHSKLRTQNSKLHPPFTLDQINPFYFPEPLAPLVAARKQRRRITLPNVLARIRSIVWHSVIPEFKVQSSKFKVQGSPVLLLEGIGGLLVPLGPGFTVLDLISHLEAALQFPSYQFRLSVLVVARNSLGTLNHSLLTIHALRAAGLPRIKLVLMGPRLPDASSGCNKALLHELLAPNVTVFSLPFLGTGCTNLRRLPRLALHAQVTINKLLL